MNCWSNPFWLQEDCAAVKSMIWISTISSSRPRNTTPNEHTKSFFGYSPGVAVIGNNIVGIENRDGNANVRFCQQHTLERIFTRLENNGIRINRARMDCGSCSEEIVDMVKAHCNFFYIRANRCSAFYEDMFILRGWRTEKINGMEFELSNGKKITSYSFKIFCFLSLAIFYPSLVLLGSASAVV